LIKEEKISRESVDKVIVKAHRGIKSAIILVEDNDLEGGYELSYEAMLLAGRALVFSFNFRPRTIGSHKTVVEFVEKVFGKEDGVLAAKFNKMRKNRHYLIYGSGLAISQTEAKNAIISARVLLEKVEKNIQERSPQGKLEL